MTKQATAIWFLNNILSGTERALYYFKEYLNTQNKDDWDLYNGGSLNWFGYSQILEKKLLPNIPEKKLEYLIELANSQYKYSNYVEGNRHPEESALKVISILTKFYKETFLLFKDQVSNLKIKSDEDIILYSGYDSSIDNENFIIQFKEHLKKVYLVNKF